MEQLLAHARRLGAAIAANETCTALKSAVAALKSDEEARQLEQDYAVVAKRIEEQGAAGQPIEPDDKRREADLRTKMAGHPAIREFLRAQADFHQLMQQVNRTLEESINLDA